MNTATVEQAVVKTKNGKTLVIAPGTEAAVPYGEVLAFWEKVWAETESLRPNYSVVEEFLLEKRVEVERENREFDE